MTMAKYLPNSRLTSSTNNDKQQQQSIYPVQRGNSSSSKLSSNPSDLETMS
nr:2909_t:CDS:2 [Entrophospora candida]